MSKSVDERVVQMQFENKQFESNARTTMNTIDSLKKSLNFSGAAKSFDEVNKASKSINFSSLLSSVETISSRFSTLGVIGVTALQNITNQALSTAQNLLNSLTLAPITAGFQEYETQIGAIQTILANTSMQGTTLEQVTAALDELNTYADKTIYNFTEMTRNIGTFTAAGVDLQTSVESIKGIANLAAMSGSTSQQASTVMYQLSQALAAGRVSLQDWNSVVNAGMGGKVFQEALMQTAEVMGIAVDRSVSFRESISAAGGQDSWLTSEVLLNTLRQFTGDMTDAELAAMGFSDAQIKSIQTQAKTANEAATQVKTLTQLFDTMGESVTSGWTETWEIIIGDFGEARELFTEVSNVFGEFVGNMSDARNNLLRGGLMSGWKQFLNEGISNQDDFIESIRKVSKEYGITEETIDGLIEKHGTFEDSLKEGWMTADILTSSVSDYANRLNSMSQEELEAAGYTSKHVEELNKLNEGLQNGTVNADEFIMKMSRDSGRENIIEGLSEAFRVLLEVIKPVGEAFNNVFESLKPEQLYQATVSFREFFTNLSLGEANANNLRDTFQGLFSVFDMLGKVISAGLSQLSKLTPILSKIASSFLAVTGAVGRWFTALNESFTITNAIESIERAITPSSENMAGALDLVSKSAATLGDMMTYVWDTSIGVLDRIAGAAKTAFNTLGNAIPKVFNGIIDTVGKVFSWIKENISAGDIFAGLAGGGIFLLAKKLSDLVSNILSIFDGFKEKSSGMKDSLNEVLAISAAVMILVSAIKKLSEINPVKISYSLVTVRLLIASLTSGFKSLQKTLKEFNSKGTLSASLTMIAMATAVNILTNAIVKLGSLNIGEIAKGVATVGALLLELSLAIKVLNGSKDITLRTSIAILALSVACKNLTDALIPLSGLSWEEIGRGLTAMGGALVELSVTMAVLNKFGGFGSVLGSVGILIAVQSLETLASGLNRLGSMSWTKIKKGLTAMGIALAELTTSLSILSAVGGFGALLGGTAILVAVQSLDEIASGLEKLSSMTWVKIGKGLTAMGIAFGELTIALSVLSAVGGFGAILGGAAILVTVQSLDEISENLKKLGSMTWEEIGRGLTAMGVALTELAAVSGILGKLAGLSGLLGAATIVVAAQGLDEIANALSKFGSMTWDEIGRGLAAMGGALLELAAVSGGLGYLTGIAGLIGAGSILVAVQGLDEIADALAKFGAMSWDEIGRGLSAMAGSLGSVAFGSFLNTLSFLGAASLSKVVGPLGDLADALKKWSGVRVPEDLSVQLQALSSGINSFTFSGAGASSIATFAEPLGTLADSVNKWSGVSIPNGLGTQISSLAIGINSFTFSGAGANSISTFAEPIGILADSVKKWEGIDISPDLGTQISSLAIGVNSFTFSGFGADALSKVAPGLGELSDAVRKWSGITIPEELGPGLTSLASGVKAFTFAFAGGWSINEIKQPLIDLANSVLAWKNVNIPENIESDLTALANGVKSFSFAFTGGWSISQIVTPLAELSESVKKWVGVDISGVGPQITSFATGVKSLDGTMISEDFITQLNDFFALFGSENFSAFLTNVGSFSTAMSQLSSIDTTAISSIKDSFSSLAETSVQTIISNFVTGVTNAAPQLQTIGTQICASISSAITVKLPMFVTYGSMAITSFNNGLTQSIPITRTTMDSVLIGIFGKITEKLPMFMTYGMNSATNYNMGISSKAGDAKTAAFALVNSALEGFTSTYEAFYSAGENAGSGFVDGLSKYASQAAEAASKMAQSAVDSVNKALDAHSPSKKTEQSGIWGGEGLVIGLKSMTRSVEKASFSLGETSVSSMKDAISRARAIMNERSDTELTIKPVVDLSDVNAKMRVMNSMLDSNRRVSIDATEARVTAAAMGIRSRQNGVNSTPEGETGTPAVQNFNFTQNNYSPKALSRADIYRQTKNQFSRAKGMVNKK